MVLNVTHAKRYSGTMACWNKVKNNGLVDKLAENDYKSFEAQNRNIVHKVVQTSYYDFVSNTV